MILALLACGAFAAWAASSAVASIRAVASLTPPGAPGQVLGPIAVAGSTLIAVPFHSEGVTAYVFTAPATGWTNATATARLIDSTGTPAQPSPAGVSGKVAVVSENPGGAGPNFEDVFVEPSGGWSGDVTESARLSASDGAMLYGATVFGRTIAVEGVEPTTGRGAIYVFTEPLTGWSGSVHESAMLFDSRGGSVGLGASDGPLIVGGTRRGADVFVQPPDGWAGALHESAVLDTLGSAAGPTGIAGASVLVGTRIFHMPPRGWTGVIRPAARLFVDASGALVTGAFSGDVAALSSFSLGAEHDCPCHGTVTLFAKPPSGWSGVRAAQPQLSVDTLDGPVSVALDGDNLFVSGGTTVAVDALSGSFGRAPAPPAISRPRIDGLASGTPTLRLTAVARPASPRLASLRLTLPPSLAFAHSRRRVRAAITLIHVASPVVKINTRALNVSFVSSHASITLKIASGALIENAALRRRAHKLRRLVIPLQLRLTDVLGATRVLTPGIPASG